MALLSWMIFLPIIASIVLFLLPLPLRLTKFLALAASSTVAVLSLFLYTAFEPVATMQFVEHTPWIATYGISYHVGVDGVSLPLVMMVALLMPLIGIGLFNRDRKGIWLNLLLAQGGIMGAVLALDMMLFYLFWETMLLPIFFMIGLFGYGRQHFITMKFTVYTIFGSLVMLVGLLFVAVSYYQQTGSFSFALDDLRTVVLTQTEALLAFFAFMLAFAIKVPLFPFHTWLSDTYRSAPTGAVVVLSALMAKLGVYAIWRFLFTLFESTSHDLAPWFVGIGLFGLIYFGVVAIRQQHIKRLFAYSSASHLSLMVVGIFIYDLYGLSGASYLIAAHALASGGLFIMVGMLYERTHTHAIDAMGGIATAAPRFALFFAFFALAIVGIPGTAGFVAELLIVLGAFHYHPVVGFISAVTILIAMLFMFTMLTKTLYGQPQEGAVPFRDLSRNEIAALAPIALLILAMGLFPDLFMDKIEPTLEASIHAEKVIHVH
jgi:NADH-quinone oxidoreductase subunit M